MAGSKKVVIKEEEPTAKPVEKPKVGLGPSMRLITGSYEHNLLCVSLSLGDKPSEEVFTPIFHFTAHTASIRCIAASKRYLVSGSNDEHIRIYDLQKRKELGNLLHHNGSITSLEFFKDKWLLSGAGDGKISLWRTKDWEVLSDMKGHKGEINDTAVHPTGKIALSVGVDRTLRLWNLMTGKKASVLKLRTEGRKVKWSSDGSYFVVAYDRMLEVYDSATSKCVHNFKFESPMQHMNVFTSKEGTEYVVTSHNNGKINFYALTSLLADGIEPEFVLSGGHAVRVKHFSFMYLPETDRDYLTSVSSDGKILVTDLTSHEARAVYQTSERLNCCLIVPESVEKYETAKKRGREEDDEEEEEVNSDLEQSDNELIEEIAKSEKKKKKKKAKKAKKPKVTVDLE
ncbi:protein Mak11p [Trichomonascus vanleenenianus]|uniref:Mak11p n=1 Tax=Trichomonascus vanleenenianus TaxID=2268995 RepID=UPI003ECA14E2